VDPTSRHAGAASRHSRKLPSAAAASTTTSSSSSSKAHTSHLSAPAAPLHVAPPAPPAAGTATTAHASSGSGSSSGHSSAASLLLHPHRAVARLSSALHSHTNRYYTQRCCAMLYSKQTFEPHRACCIHESKQALLAVSVLATAVALMSFAYSVCLLAMLQRSRSSTKQHSSCRHQASTTLQPEHGRKCMLYDIDKPSVALLC
jgi:hypothetical protein